MFKSVTVYFECFLKGLIRLTFSFLEETPFIISVFRWPWPPPAPLLEVTPFTISLLDETNLQVCQLIQGMSDMVREETDLLEIVTSGLSLKLESTR